MNEVARTLSIVNVVSTSLQCVSYRVSYKFDPVSAFFKVLHNVFKDSIQAKKSINKRRWRDVGHVDDDNEILPDKSYRSIIAQQDGTCLFVLCFKLWK